MITNPKECLEWLIRNNPEIEILLQESEVVEYDDACDRCGKPGGYIETASEFLCENCNSSIVDFCYDMFKDMGDAISEIHRGSGDK